MFTSGLTWAHAELTCAQRADLCSSQAHLCLSRAHLCSSWGTYVHLCSSQAHLRSSRSTCAGAHAQSVPEATSPRTDPDLPAPCPVGCHSVPGGSQTGNGEKAETPQSSGGRWSVSHLWLHLWLPRAPWQVLTGALPTASRTGMLRVRRQGLASRTEVPSRAHCGDLSRGPAGNSPGRHQRGHVWLRGHALPSSGS